MDMKRLKSLLSELEDLGYEVTSNGYIIYGNLATGRSRGWLHKIYPPIPVKNFERTLRDCPYLTDYSYADQLRKVNGVSLFSGRLVTYGLHQYDTPLQGPGMPFNILNSNYEDQHIAEEIGGLIIGGKKRDGEVDLLVQKPTGSVVCVVRDRLILSEGWQSTDDLLEQECLRLTHEFRSANPTA